MKVLLLLLLLLFTAIGFSPGGSRWRRVIPQRKSPQYPLNKRFGGPLRWSGYSGEEIPLLVLFRIEPGFLTNTPQSLYKLSYPSYLVTYTHRFSLKIVYH
jgi:hypothetical protein